MVVCSSQGHGEGPKTEEATWWSGNGTCCSQITIIIIPHQGQEVGHAPLENVDGTLEQIHICKTFNQSKTVQGHLGGSVG